MLPWDTTGWRLFCEHDSADRCGNCSPGKSVSSDAWVQFAVFGREGTKAWLDLGDHHRGRDPCDRAPCWLNPDVHLT